MVTCDVITHKEFDDVLKANASKNDNLSQGLAKPSPLINRTFQVRRCFGKLKSRIYFPSILPPYCL